MTQARRHNWDRNTGIEHLRFYEMAEVVESKVTEPGGSSHTDEPLSDAVRRPRPSAMFVGTDWRALRAP
jgi:hypothetical protein